MFWVYVRMFRYDDTNERSLGSFLRSSLTLQQYGLQQCGFIQNWEYFGDACIADMQQIYSSLHQFVPTQVWYSWSFWCWKWNNPGHYINSIPVDALTPFVARLSATIYSLCTVNGFLPFAVLHLPVLCFCIRNHSNVNIFDVTQNERSTKTVKFLKIIDCLVFVRRYSWWHAMALWAKGTVHLHGKFTMFSTFAYCILGLMPNLPFM